MIDSICLINKILGQSNTEFFHYFETIYSLNKQADLTTRRAII